MSLSEKSIKESQEIYKEKYGKEISYKETAESGERLVNLVKLLFNCAIEEKRRKKKLDEFPRGYSLMDGGTYDCGICHNSIKDEQLWYDKWVSSALLARVW